MIITQKYNSAKDIDVEFIPELEELLCDCVPSFDLIKKYEEDAPENTHFAYYLFFGQQTNAPIGFAQLEIEDKPTKPSLFEKVLRKKKPQAKIKWFIPGSLKEGLIFNPKYIQNACQKAKKIFMEYQSRDDIQEQELVFSSAYQSMEQIETPAEKEQKHFEVAETLIKNKPHYQAYFESLPESLQTEIKQGWREIHQQKLSMGDYARFKECFEYKEKGSEQYRTLKKNLNVLKYLALDSQIEFITLENDNEVQALVFFFEGKNGNCFYDIIQCNTSEAVAHQLAIVKFFDRDHLNRLHALGDYSDLDYLFSLGFTKREQYHLRFKKYDA